MRYVMYTSQHALFELRVQMPALFYVLYYWQVLHILEKQFKTRVTKSCCSVLSARQGTTGF